MSDDVQAEEAREEMLKWANSRRSLRDEADYKKLLLCQAEQMRPGAQHYRQGKLPTALCNRPSDPV
jgi:hypothetical protein